MTQVKTDAVFNRANISIKDFEEAENYLKEYSTEHSAVLQRAVKVAAIIAYARPFTINKGGDNSLSTPTLKARPDRILDERELVLHKRVIELRNKGVAHSDYELRPTRIVEKRKHGFLTVSQGFDVLSENIPIDQFLSICDKMKRHCVGVLFNLGRDPNAEL